MNHSSSRREFLTAGVAAGVTGFWSPRARTAAYSDPVPHLHHRILGRTGLKVTALGFGCAFTPDASVIERAADLGINYFDTAPVYQQGNNERLVGVGLKRKRKDVILSTKTEADDKPQALKSLENSLRELGTDYLDIWYLHARQTPESVKDDLLEAQQVAKQQGKIRFTGASTHAAKTLVPTLIQKGCIDVVLATYNFSMDPGVGAALAQANQAGLGVLGMKVMAGGYRKLVPGEPASRQLKSNAALLAALKWVMKNPNVHSSVTSITDMDQLDEDFRAMSEPFGPADDKLLAEHLQYLSPLYCRMCGECEGKCAKNLPVADILRHLNYADGYGQFVAGREGFLKLGPEVASVRCSDCGHCTVECPSGVHVSARLRRAQEIFANHLAT